MITLTKTEDGTIKIDATFSGDKLEAHVAKVEDGEYVVQVADHSMQPVLLLLNVNTRTCEFMDLVGYSAGPAKAA